MYAFPICATYLAHPITFDFINKIIYWKQHNVIIYGSFNEAVNVSDYNASNGRMVSE